MFSRKSAFIFMSMVLRCLAAIEILAALVPATANAGEPLFGYSYTTDLLPKGKWEIEQWLTDREGQAMGYFHHVDMRSELEYGITDNFQIAGYLNYMYADESGNSVRGKTEGIEMPFDHNADSRYNEGRFDGLSIEATYRFLSPYTNPVGLAFYVEPALGYFENGLEFRGILQKNFLDDQLVLVGNFWVEFDREKGSNLVTPGSNDVPDGGFHDATYAELDLGASYRFAPKWFAGLEFRNHNEYQGFTMNHDAQDHTAFFLGPNLHYASENWFATFAVLRQVAATAYTIEQKAQTANGLLYGDEHTTWDGIRLIVGFPL
jgi:hypothetical protein